MSARIRVDEDTDAALEAPKGDEETSDELLSRRRRERGAIIEAGAGLWAGTDAAEGARETGEDTREDVGAR